MKCAELDQSRSRIEELRVTQRRQNWVIIDPYQRSNKEHNLFIFQAIQEIKHKKVVFVAKQEKYQKIRARTEMMGQELGKLKQGCVSIVSETKYVYY